MVSVHYPLYLLLLKPLSAGFSDNLCWSSVLQGNALLQLHLCNKGKRLRAAYDLWVVDIHITWNLLRKNASVLR